jgi:hypothetical protein
MTLSQDHGNVPPWMPASTSSEAPTVTPEARRKELAAAREEFAASMPQQALRLLDDHSSLMFDVHSVFTVSGEGTQERSINLLIDDITSFSPPLMMYRSSPLPFVVDFLL